MKTDFALTLEGGGFLSVAAQSAIVSGLMAANTRRSKDLPSPTVPTNLEASRLLEKFGTISAVSGGAWFSCSLAYSTRFLQLVENMAFTPEAAGTKFDEDWIQSWLSIGEDAPFFVRLAARLAERAEDPVVQQTLLQVGFFLKDGFTWNNYTRTLLDRTASIDPDIPMGSKVQTWANGKQYLVGVTEALPNGRNGFDSVVVFPPGQDVTSRRTFASYTARVPNCPNVDPEAFPAYIPAAFSVIFGSGQNSDAPFRYVSKEPSAFPPGTTLMYKGAGPGDGLFGFCHQQRFSGETAPLGHMDNFNFFGGSLTLGEVISCSSSFMGDIAMLPQTDESDPFQTLARAVNGDLSTWAGSGAHAQGVTEPLAVVNEIYEQGRVKTRNFDSLVSNGVRCTIDGGFTDATGIANAVAAGAKNLVVISNRTNSEEPTHVIDLFGGQEPAAMKGFVTKRRFRGDLNRGAGDPTTACESSADFSFPIFAESKERARLQWKAIQATGSLQIPEGSNTQLISMAVGSMRATTAFQKFFGIAEGIDVNLHIIFVNSKLNSGSFVDFTDYATLVQEIMNTILSPVNQTLVEDTILPYFVESPPEQPQGSPACKYALGGA